ncbi:MAG TPA: TetR/AcrR family transcriptional regulator [Candidatus Cybelea sp.]|nr:TetR/AcrR family transcriptional regulator [Candidatus Cybelea sp.]
MSASAKSQGPKGPGEKGHAAKRQVPTTSPRDRIVEAASDLFYRHGIRAVGVDAIAEAAGTNKMTLYRHFTSKDELVAECLRRHAQEIDHYWDELAANYAGDPEGEIRAWLAAVSHCVTSEGERGCAMANAAVELPEKDHPGRAVIEAAKTGHRERLVELFRDAKLSEPEALADEIFLLIEGARINIQSVGTDGPASRLVRMIEALIESRRPASSHAA